MTTLGEVEAAAFGGTGWEDQQPIDRLAGLARSITAGEWWRCCAGPAVTVEAARVTARSSTARTTGPGRLRVRLAPGQRDRATLAHELAHALAGVDDGHGPRFRAALVDVVTVLVDDASGASDPRLGAELARFGLSVAERPWPAPWRWSGTGFVVG